MGKNERTLALVQFALENQSVPPTTYHIGTSGDEKRVFDKLCLLDLEHDGWIVAFSERGQLSQQAVHTELSTAALEFYWRLVRKDTFWDFRGAWEAETGELF